MDVVSFNSIYEDPEQMKELRDTIVQASQMDPNGRINMEAGIDMILNIADPMLADVMLLPTEQGIDKIVTGQEDITKMSSGLAVGAPQNAAQLRLQNCSSTSSPLLVLLARSRNFIQEDSRSSCSSSGSARMLRLVARNAPRQWATSILKPE